MTATPIPIREITDASTGSSAASHSGKRAYLTVESARSAAVLLQSKKHNLPNRPKRIVIYRCGTCSAFHVGTAGGRLGDRQERRAAKNNLRPEDVAKAHNREKNAAERAEKQDREARQQAGRRVMHVARMAQLTSRP